MLRITSISCETALQWIPQNTFDDKPMLVKIMAWQQCWPSFMLSYGITRPQWVKIDKITNYSRTCHWNWKIITMMNFSSKWQLLVQSVMINSSMWPPLYILLNKAWKECIIMWYNVNICFKAHSNFFHKFIQYFHQNFSRLLLIENNENRKTLIHTKISTKIVKKTWKSG